MEKHHENLPSSELDSGLTCIAHKDRKFSRVTLYSQVAPQLVMLSTRRQAAKGRNKAQQFAVETWKEF